MSTIKSSAEDLTLNADGSNEIKFQINAVEKASISSAGLLTSTTIDATALTGNLPAISGASLTGLTSAQMPAGSVLQVVSNTWTTATSVASTSYTSVGDSATSITPSATTSKILILVNFQAFIRFDDEGHQYASFEITRDTDTTVREFGAAIREYYLAREAPDAGTAKLWGGNFGMSFLDSPSSTSSLEYALTMKCLTTSSTGRVIVNEAGTGAASTITLMEIGA